MIKKISKDMELTFVESSALGNIKAWQCEFEVTADFNLHIEREKGGRIFFYQRTSAEGGYAHIDNVGWQDGKPVIDLDFAGLIYPKYIKVVTEIQPTKVEVTCPDGEVTQIGGNNGEGDDEGPSFYITMSYNGETWTEKFPYQQGMTFETCLSTEYERYVFSDSDGQMIIYDKINKASGYIYHSSGYIMSFGYDVVEGSYYTASLS